MTNNNSFQVFKGGWEELENAIFTDNIGSTVTGSKTFFIKPDGSMVFTIQGITVEEHDLTTPWDISTIKSTSKTFSITEDSVPNGIYFKDDGTKMFIAGNFTTTLYEYDLDPAWDISSAQVNTNELDLSDVGTVIQCVFSQTGNFVFITSGASVFSYPLDTDWNVGSNTASFTTFTPTSPAIDVDSVAFKSEGDKMYIGEIAGADVREYNLTSEYIIEDATDNGNVLDLSIESHIPTDIFWRSNGTQLFVFDSTVDKIIKYFLQSQWDISTASFFTNSTSTTGSPRDVNFTPDGLAMFTLDSSSNVVSGFDLSEPFNVGTAVPRGITFTFSGDESNGQGMWWINDGKSLLIVGAAGDTVFQYDNTAGNSYDLVNLPDNAFDDSFKLFSTAATPTGIWVSSDGKKLYVITITPTDEIFQYDLATANTLPPDLTSADSTFDVSTENTSTRGLFMKPNGKELYVIFDNPSEVVRYTLSTPFLIESAVFQDRLDVAFPLPASSNGLFIEQNNGKRLLVIDRGMDLVRSFDMSLEFNTSMITNLGDELVTNAGDTLVFA